MKFSVLCSFQLFLNFELLSTSPTSGEPKQLLDEINTLKLNNPFQQLPHRESRSNSDQETLRQQIEPLSTSPTSGEPKQPSCFSVGYKEESLFQHLPHRESRSNVSLNCNLNPGVFFQHLPHRESRSNTTLKFLGTGSAFFQHLPHRESRSNIRRTFVFGWNLYLFQHLPHRESRSNNSRLATFILRSWSFNISHIGRAEATPPAKTPTNCAFFYSFC